MIYNVKIVEDAETDILNIFLYVELQDSNSRAAKLLEEVEEKCLSLELMPDRGHVPPELMRIGISNFKEIHCKLYRIIYEISGKNVIILCVLDGRRNIRDVLEERVLR
jgi:toxin ParE1/3/4